MLGVETHPCELGTLPRIPARRLLDFFLLAMVGGAQTALIQGGHKVCGAHRSCLRKSVEAILSSLRGKFWQNFRDVSKKNFRVTLGG